MGRIEGEFCYFSPAREQPDSERRTGGGPASPTAHTDFGCGWREGVWVWEVGVGT